MLMLVTRSYAGEKDLEPIANLLNACEIVDCLDEYHTVADLQMEFSAPHVNPDRDLRLWENSNGDLIAFGQLWIPTEAHPVDGYLWFRVHPDSRNQGLEADVIAWGESRMREVGRERNAPAQLRASSRDSQSERIKLFKAHGFQVDRRFLTLERSLAIPFPDPQFPPGFICRGNQGKAEAHEWVEMFNESFIDHWNYHPATVERRLHWLDHPQYRADLDLVGVAPDGTLAVFCYCCIDTEENRHTNRNDGWIDLLGTRRGFRRMGLGRAILLAGLDCLRAEGITTAKIGVDTQNPNQAQRLYESVGFQHLHGSLSFVKDL
ncbi:MAG: GNAT family N-acetyltransferase [Elainellaceae cyanobacterium]